MWPPLECFGDAHFHHASWSTSRLAKNKQLKQNIMEEFTKPWSTKNTSSPQINKSTRPDTGVYHPGWHWRHVSVRVLSRWKPAAPAARISHHFTCSHHPQPKRRGSPRMGVDQRYSWLRPRNLIIQIRWLTQKNRQGMSFSIWLFWWSPCWMGCNPTSNER